MSNTLNRFLEYVKVDTESVSDSDTCPSSKKQLDLSKILANELKELGASNVELDDHGYVYAKIPATTTKKVPTIGFIAHVDTSSAVSGKDVKAQIIKNYNGKDIVLNKALDIILSPNIFKDLLYYKGEDLVVTNGTTLLGADDKAGIAEIMSMAEYFLSNKSIPHGTIKIAFTPDEEIGRGADFFDVKKFGADFAYTVDGGRIGELEYENFNAAGAKITINGVSVHPGSSKGMMKNAILMAMEFQTMLPVFENPMHTEWYEGFYHLDKIKGNVEKVICDYIIRDHDRQKFENKKVLFIKVADFLNEKYGKDTFIIDMEDNYYNMQEMIEPHMEIIELVKKTMLDMEIEPIIKPIRGGTDGSRLSFMGLPCPNICAGGHNFHGKFEYISVHSMNKITDLLINVVKNLEKQK
jgi:peptidase T